LPFFRGDFGATFAGVNVVVGTDGDGVDDGAEGNLISGNHESGVSITDPGTTGNVVAGNRIGTNRAGSAALPNGMWGVTVGLLAGPDNVIGTDGNGSANDAGERNLISGNGEAIRLFGSSTGTVIAGNRIGTNAAGTMAVPNTGIAVFEMETVADTRIGTNGDGVSDDVEGNLVSGNGYLGMLLQGAGTQVAGNLVGTTRTGLAPLPNASGGITVEDGVLTTAGPMTIGGSSAVFRNVIAGHMSVGGNANGIHVRASDITVECNYIGTDLTGTAALPNDVGIFVLAGAGNVVQRNLVAFNTLGALISPDTVTIADNSISGNVDGLVYGGPGKLGQRATSGRTRAVPATPATRVASATRSSRVAAGPPTSTRS
jgi:titin